MKEVIERWKRTGYIKSITYYYQDIAFDKLVFDKYGNYKEHVMIYDLEREICND